MEISKNQFMNYLKKRKTRLLLAVVIAILMTISYISVQSYSAWQRDVMRANFINTGIFWEPTYNEEDKILQEIVNRRIIADAKKGFLFYVFDNTYAVKNSDAAYKLPIVFFAVYIALTLVVKNIMIFSWIRKKIINIFMFFWGDIK